MNENNELWIFQVRFAMSEDIHIFVWPAGLEKWLVVFLSLDLLVTIIKTPVLLQRSGLAQCTGRSGQLPPLFKGEVLHRHSALCNLRLLPSQTVEYSSIFQCAEGKRVPSPCPKRRVTNRRQHIFPPNEKMVIYYCIGK